MRYRSRFSPVLDYTFIKCVRKLFLRSALKCHKYSVYLRLNYTARFTIISSTLMSNGFFSFIGFYTSKLYNLANVEINFFFVYLVGPILLEYNVSVVIMLCSLHNWVIFSHICFPIVCISIEDFNGLM